MASQYPPGPGPTEPFADGPDDPYGGPPTAGDGGPDRRWIWPAAAFAAVAGILVAVLVVVLVSDDDGDDEQVVVPTETETPTPSPTETPSPSPTPTAAETEEPTPSPTEDEDDDDGDNDDGGGEPASVIDIDDSGDQVVYLTFDAGSDRGFAEDILDLLDDEEVSASFGITGEWAEENPDLVERLVDDGHVLFNHTYSHRSFTGFSSGEEPLSEDERREEITRTDEIFVDITDTDGTPFWRPPFGDFDDETLVLLGELDYPFCLMWTIDSLGWDGLSEEEIIDRVLGNMEPGAIVLLHVGSQSQDFAALDDIIQSLRDDGYDFATVDRLDQN